MISEPIIQPLISDFTKKHGISLFVKRLDLIHPTIKGNKWYKLKYNLAEAKKQGKNILLTFGGAYSNHIYATAAAGKLFGFKTIGVIRGEESTVLNPILTFAKDNDMELYYVNREIYKTIREFNSNLLINSNDITNIIRNLPFEEIYSHAYIIPEGGSNHFAVKGCKEISENITNNLTHNFDVICCACGTGSTLAGIILGCPDDIVQKIGFAVLKGGDFLKHDVQKLIDITLPLCESAQINNFSIETDYHFGGYAKKNMELLNFITNFQAIYNIKIEPTYTGKMFYGLFDLIGKGYFKENSKILAIHTGGVYE